MSVSTARSSLFLRVLDWWRPTRDLTPAALFQLRCVVGGALFGVVVALYSFVQSSSASATGRLILASYAAGSLVLLLAARLGVRPAWLAWAAILQLGVFLSCVALLTTSARLDQLFWLVLLPLGARAIFPDAGQDPRAPVAGSRRATLLGAIAAVALGVAVLVAQANGISMGQTPREVPPLLKGTEHLLFVVTVVGLLWLHEVTVRATLDELRLLQRLLTYCAWCHDVRDEDGAWIPPDLYLERHGRAPVTHGICPDCLVTHGQAR